MADAAKISCFRTPSLSRFLRKRWESRTTESSASSASHPFAMKPAKGWGTGSWLKALEAAILAVAICFSLGASNASSRFNDLGHRLMCTCSCAQLLGECNHVGCPESGHMRNELSAAIAAGLGNQQILDAFAARYGMTVLAAPPTKGFDLIAWIAPFAVFAAALVGTMLLVRRWTGLGGKPLAAVAAEQAALDPEERKRLDRIRRETNIDGGEGGF